MVGPASSFQPFGATISYELWVLVFVRAPLVASNPLLGAREGARDLAHRALHAVQVIRTVNGVQVCSSVPFSGTRYVSDIDDGLVVLESGSPFGESCWMGCQGCWRCLGWPRCWAAVSRWELCGALQGAAKARMVGYVPMYLVASP